MSATRQPYRYHLVTWDCWQHPEHPEDDGVLAHPSRTVTLYRHRPATPEPTPDPAARPAGCWPALLLALACWVLLIELGLAIVWLWTNR